MRCVKCRIRRALRDEVVCLRCSAEAEAGPVVLVPLLDVPWRDETQDRRTT